MRTEFHHTLNNNLPDYLNLKSIMSFRLTNEENYYSKPTKKENLILSSYKKALEQKRTDIIINEINNMVSSDGISFVDGIRTIRFHLYPDSNNLMKMYETLFLFDIIFDSQSFGTKTLKYVINYFPIDWEGEILDDFILIRKILDQIGLFDSCKFDINYGNTKIENTKYEYIEEFLLKFDSLYFYEEAFEENDGPLFEQIDCIFRNDPFLDHNYDLIDILNEEKYSIFGYYISKMESDKIPWEDMASVSDPEDLLTVLDDENWLRGKNLSEYKNFLIKYGSEDLLDTFSDLFD